MSAFPLCLRWILAALVRSIEIMFSCLDFLVVLFVTKSTLPLTICDDGDDTVVMVLRYITVNVRHDC